MALDRESVTGWVTAYESAWRTVGTGKLSELFAPDVVYVPSPWARPLRGLGALSAFWQAERNGPDEAFALRSDVVAVDGRVAVVRVSVDYADPSSGRWRDLWVLRFDTDGRCTEFEEWPFAPGQSDGHGGAGTEIYQPSEPGSPLNGPATWDVIQPP
ncbi:MAG: nuclear transport factor 2 family protein [Acidimicrobiales bacterium]